MINLFDREAKAVCLYFRSELIIKMFTLYAGIR